MRALIFGLDLNIGATTASQIMGHERAVKASFLATSDYDAEIVISSNRDIIDGEPDLYARIPKTSTSYPGYMFDLQAWIAERPDRYSVMVFSYTVSAWEYKQLETIARDYGIHIFCAMPNDGIRAYGTNIFLIGGGDPTNTKGTGYGLTTYGLALNRPTASQATTSYTTGAVAGHFTKWIDLGLTFVQTRKAFLQSLPNYPEKTIQNGYGIVNTTPAIPQSYDLFPPCSVWYYNAGGITEQGVKIGQRYYIYWCPFLGQASDFVIRDGDTIVYEGAGESRNDAGWIGTADLRRFTYDIDTDGDHVLSITAKDGTESDLPAYLVQTVSVSGIEPAPEPPPEPEPVPEPVEPPEPEPEPELPPIDPSPSVFLSRNGTTNTLTTDGGGTVQTFERRNNVQGEWQAVDTTDTQPADQTFMYRVKVSDGVTESAWSDTVYSVATQTSTQKLTIL